MDLSSFLTAFEQNQWIERTLVIVFLVIGMAIGMRHAKTNRDALMLKLKNVADHFGLKFINPQNNQLPQSKSKLISGFMALATKYAWSMEGIFQQTQFHVMPIEKRVGTGRRRRKVIYTQICASFPKSLNAGLNIYREGFFSKIGKMFGAKDIQTGTTDFDKKFILKGDNESILVPLLSNPNVQQAIIALFDLGDQVEFDDEGITMECKKIVQTIEEYEPRLRLMADAIKAFTK